MDYNPRRPSVMGQEWVPVTYEPYQPDWSVERGYRFALSAPAVPLLGQYYLHAEPTGVTTTQVPMVSLYRAGEEGATGPAQTVVIPCSSASASGTHGQFVSGTGADVLQSASDGKSFSLTSGGPVGTAAGTLDLAFDTSAYLGVLGSKRILNVSILYAATGDWVTANALPSIVYTSVRYRGTEYEYGSGVLTADPSYRGEYTRQISAINLGEINPNWSTVTFEGTTQRYPWRAQELAQFDESNVDPARFRFQWSVPTTTSLSLQYAAMQVTYCEETRVYYGGVTVGSDQQGTQPDVAYTPGLNTVVLRTASGHATGTGIPAGQYTITTHLADIGDTITRLIDVPAASITRPTMQALRQAYEIPGMRGVEVVRPARAGDVAQVARVDVLPYVSFAPTGGSNAHADTHAYGTQYAAHVYQGMNAQQAMGSNPAIPATAYTWIRFYARRYGDTSGPLTVTVDTGGTPVTTSITAEDFDALTEIAAGWREVTLRLSSAATLDGTYRYVTWSSPSPAGARWEILAANGDSTNAVSNWLTGFLALIANGATQATADAAVILSTESPAPTGVAVTTQTQALGSARLLCSDPDGCIPTGLAYNQVSWSPPNGTQAGYDTFTRSVTNSWGTATTGQTWFSAGGSVVDYQVNGAQGVHVLNTNNVARRNALSGDVADFTVTALAIQGSAASGAAQEAGLVGRFIDGNNQYVFRTRLNVDGSVTAAIGRNVTGSLSMITPDVPVPGCVAGTGARFRMRAEGEGSTLRWRVWQDGREEPATWTVTVTDTTYPTGRVGCRSMALNGNLLTGPQILYDDFTVTPLASTHGHTEVQRLDYADAVWETIARITSPGVTSMRDYEARVGTLSVYRVRWVNALGFEGAWSSAVGAILATPGVSGAGDAPGLLAFTSNGDQSGARTYAYLETGDGPPPWEAQYREAGQVTENYLDGRDYSTAEHRAERGGVQFSAALLTDRGTPSTAALERGWRGLRDMAWADLPYVCVRTGAGDRWYASVRVGGGTMQRRTGDYIGVAQVTVTQTQGAPTPVDIPWGP